MNLYVREYSVLGLLLAGDGVLKVTTKLKRVLLHLNDVRTVEGIFVSLVDRVVLTFRRRSRLIAFGVEILVERVTIASAVDDSIAEIQIASLQLIIHGKIWVGRCWKFLQEIGSRKT